MPDSSTKKRVLILHTGGTLGMPPRGTNPGRARPGPLAPERYARDLLGQVPELAELADVSTRIRCNLDSSDIGPDEWSALADDVAEARAGYDGVVIVHGTDTMAYTASALSFALRGLDRPVILTGSQRPLGAVRTDARRNLVDAVDLACRDLPEVGLCFDGRLLRGNRATKGDAFAYAAFSSPGCPPLARLGLDVEVAAHVRRPSEPFRCAAAFDPRVAVVTVTPGFDPGQLGRLLGGDDDAPRGLLLLAFGVGNVPARVRPVAPAVRAAVDAGVTVLVVSQARAGGVDLGLYENGAVLADAGAVSGGGMGLEAATVKLMHAIALHPGDRAARERLLLADLAGERGEPLAHLAD